MNEKQTTGTLPFREKIKKTALYGIREIRHYYGPKKISSWICGPDGIPITYDTREKAQAAIDEMDQCAYWTSHNESGRPEYRARRIPSDYFAD